MKPKIVIVGAGGHAKVVCDTIMHLNIYEIVGFIDIAKSDG
jgi:FlaA1/EpsC-like NDP-sugar epimerase